MLDLSKWMAWLWPNSLWVIRYYLPYYFEFHEAACYHDLAYDEWINRKKSDVIFLTMMLKTNTWYNIAFMYYIIVRLFWTFYFNYK